MLLRPNGRVRRQLSFNQQLTYLKNGRYVPQQLQKSNKNYTLTLSVLNLLIDDNPKIGEQLLILKESLTKWYDHTNEEFLSKTREILNLKQKLVIRIKKQVGIVLQEIAYYLRSIIEEFNDQHIETFYVRYLEAIKKLEWSNAVLNQDSIKKNQQIQTEPQYYTARALRNQKAFDGEGIAHLENPMKRYREVDIHKYFETKEENLQLERKCDQLKSMLTLKEEQNKKLKLEIDSVYKENKDLKESQQIYLQQVDKLTILINKLKAQIEEKQRKDDYFKRNPIKSNDEKFQNSNIIRENLFQELQKIEEKINSQKKLQQLTNDYFIKNYKIQVQSEPSIKTQKKIANNKEQIQEQLKETDEFPMLLIQAITIEGYLLKKQEGK